MDKIKLVLIILGIIILVFILPPIFKFLGELTDYIKEENKKYNAKLEYCIVHDEESDCKIFLYKHEKKEKEAAERRRLNNNIIYRTKVIHSGY